MYPRRFERACGKQETSEISNLARKDLLANTAFHSEDTSGTSFTLVSLMPVGGSNTKRFEKWGEHTGHQESNEQTKSISGHIPQDSNIRSYR